MSDSKGPEQQTITVAEREPPKSIVLGETFTFFDRPVPSGNNEIVETADILSRIKQNPVGGLIGRAKSTSGREITTDELLHISFEIRTKAEKAMQRADELQGFPFNNPIIYMETSSGTFASIGQESGKNTRALIFQDWVGITRREDATKSKIAELTKKFRAQPRTIKLSQLRETKFRIT